MDSILGFLKTQDSARVRVEGENGKSQKTKSPVRERSGRIRGSVPTGHIESEKLATLVAIHAHRANIVD
jgi:hypothetical protein